MGGDTLFKGEFIMESFFLIGIFYLLHLHGILMFFAADERYVAHAIQSRNSFTGFVSPSVHLSVHQSKTCEKCKTRVLARVQTGYGVYAPAHQSPKYCTRAQNLYLSSRISYLHITSPLITITLAQNDHLSSRITYLYVSITTVNARATCFGIEGIGDYSSA